MDRARMLSDTAEKVGRVMDLSDYAVLSAPFQLAAAEQDGPKALALLDRLLKSLEQPWDLSQSVLYRHLVTKEAAGQTQSALIPCLLEQLRADPECAFLRQLPEYTALVERYQVQE